MNPRAPLTLGSSLLAAALVFSACNQAPEGLGITIEPSEPHTLDELAVVINADAVDPNAKDEVTYRYAWTVDGSRMDGETEATVPSGVTSKGQVWEASVTPWDGKLLGTPATATVTVLNTLPTATVTALPENPVTTDDIRLDTTSADDDRDQIKLRFAWSLNGSPSSLTADTLRANRTNKGEVWEVSVYPHDGEAEGEPAVATITIGNTPPEVARAEIASETWPPTTSSTLRCDGRGWQDVDEDEEGYNVQWFVNGVSVSTDDELSGAFQRGDSVECSLTPFDGDDEGEAVRSAAVIIRNEAPTLEDVEIGPELPIATDTVTATLGASSDPDGDEVTFIYSWRVDGREVASSVELPSSRFVRGDEIVLWVTPTDGYDNGTAVKSNMLIGGNNIPEILAVSLDPKDLYTDDTLEAKSTVRDLDGDTVTLTVEWYLDGKRISPTTATLDGKVWFDHFDELYAIARPNDGVDLGKPLTSATVEVKNSKPTAPKLKFNPAEPTEGDAIQCMIDTKSTDLDKDPITYTFKWTVEGKPVAGSKTLYGNDTLGGTSWTEDDDVVCTVTPNDGYDDGEPGEASLSSGFVMFVTSRFLGSSGHLKDRAAANAKCASEATAASITGKNWKIVYSTGTEDAKDYLKYKKGDEVYDRNGKQIDGGNLFGTGRITLPKMQSHTITSTGKSGTFKVCSGSYPSGSWPICQYCSKKFACGSASDDPFNPSACCWTGTRAIVCMGEL